MVRRAVLLALASIAGNICGLSQRDGGFHWPGEPPSLASQFDSLASLTGTVITADNKPLKNARVELRDSNGRILNSTYSNASGAFGFAQIGSGTYDVVATSGLEQTHERIEVDRVPSSVRLRMPVNSAPADGNGSRTVSVAQYKVPEKARSQLKKAREAFTKGKNDEAGQYVTRALEIYPGYADALTLRAMLKMYAADESGAIADLQQAIDSDENCAMAYLVMGAALNLQSKFDDAIRALQRGEALSPDSWQAYFEMGKALIGKAQYEPALRQLDRAQGLMPKEYPLVHLLKAHAMLAINHYADAMSELQEYLEKAPAGPNTEQAQKMLAQARTFAANHPGN